MQPARMSLISSTLLEALLICIVLQQPPKPKLKLLGLLPTISAKKLPTAGIRKILENVRLAQESLPSNVVGSAQVLANVGNLLNIRDAELSRSMGDISLRKTGVEEKGAKVQKESKILLDHTRKAIASLTYLKRTFAQMEGNVVPCEAQMENWRTNLAIMVSKERQYLQQDSNCKDKALAALAIEDKKRHCAAAEKYLENVLQSALGTTE